MSEVDMELLKRLSNFEVISVANKIKYYLFIIPDGERKIYKILGYNIYTDKVFCECDFYSLVEIQKELPKKINAVLKEENLPFSCVASPLLEKYGKAKSH